MIHFGDNNVTAMIHRSDKIKKAYMGESLIWESVQLPKGYTRLKYVERVGAAFINTNYIPNVDTEFESVWKCDLSELSNWMPTTLFGAKDTANKTFYISILITKHTSATYYYMGFSKEEGGPITTSVDYENSHKIILKSQFISIDGKEAIIRKDPITEAITLPIFIFAVNNNGKENFKNTYSTIRLYSFKATTNGKTELNLIPCINAQGKYGMYDLITKQFFGNANSNGSFTGGV